MPLSKHDTVSGSAEAFDAITEEVLPTLAFTVDFAGIGISLVNKKMVEGEDWRLLPLRLLIT